MDFQYQSETLDHLGLVAEMYDELGIGGVIDRAVKQDFSQRKVSIGQAVKAMVLNGLGFANKRLYIVPLFFQDKPTELLIGDGIRAEHLNDDILGRALDSIFDNNVTTLYSMISTEAVKELGLNDTTFAHLDITSFHVDGKYNSEQPEEENVVRITKGYSRDHRSDLNQVGLQLIVEHRAGLPIWMEPLNGNASDKSEFNRLINTHIDMLQSIDYLVADSALYTEKNLKDLNEIKWISRVPETIKDAKMAIRDIPSDAMIVIDKDYSYHEIGSIYAGIKQRWLVIESKPAQEMALHTVKKIISKGGEKEVADFAKLCNLSFACAPDALKSLQDFKKTLKFIIIEQEGIVVLPCYSKTGRSKKEQEPDRLEYKISGCPATSVEVYCRLITEKGRFILATNELNENLLSCVNLLKVYKSQSKAEGGFRFMKDPLFMLSSIFLKSPKRVMALLMVMTVCLLVYAALEYVIRQKLKEQDKTIPNQKGVPIQNPTGRWIFQLFAGIHLLLIMNGLGTKEVGQIVLNINSNHVVILEALGDRYKKYYINRSNSQSEQNMK